MLKHVVLLLFLVALGAAGCVQPPPTATLTPTPPFNTATPDVNATSEYRTQVAMLTNVPLTETAAATQTAGAQPTATDMPAATLMATATERPLPTATATQKPGPTASATATLEGEPPPTPVTHELIQSFEASPAEIDPGDPVTLTWEATGDTATLYRLMPTGQLGQFWDVPLSGSMVVETSDRDRNQVQYMLFVSSGERQEQALATVRVRCTAEWFFTPAPDICPVDPAIETAAAYQPFERGHMFWLGQRARIYVLYGDGGVPAYSPVSDPWQPGLPESDPGIEPPPGLVQPVRGFGMVWRGEAEPYLYVRERVGWGLVQEVGYTALFQCDSAPKYSSCYLTGPDGAVWQLGPEGSSWRVLEGAARR